MFVSFFICSQRFGIWQMLFERAEHCRRICYLLAQSVDEIRNTGERVQREEQPRLQRSPNCMWHVNREQIP